ncbi:MAG TPA: hypothetical protein VIL48_12635 [Acidimicrobiales bacterium]
MDLSKLSVGDRIVAGVGILQILLLLFVPWHSVEIFGETYSLQPLDGDGTAIAWPAALALIVLLALVVVVLVRKLAPQVNLPALPIGWNQAIFYATIAVPVLLFLKLIAETDFLTFWAYFLVLLGCALAYGGYLISKETETSVAPPTQF